MSSDPANDSANLAICELFSRFPPDRDAIVHEGERWTYARLDAESARLAAWLVTGGVEAGDFVSFALENGPQFLALAIAIYRCGAVPAPLSPKMPERERAEILEVLKPSKFVGPTDLPAADAEFRSVPMGRPVSVSWKACTSGGSTGRPKVIVDARAAAFPPATQFIGIPSESNVLVPGPLYHNAPFSCAIFALWKGSTVFTMSRFDACGALGLIDRENVEWALMVPTMMSRMLALPDSERSEYDLGHWKQVVHTAAPLAQWQKRAWIDWLGPDHIWEVYGATEGLVRCWIGGREWLDRPGSVGKPIGGARIRILDEAGNETPAGVTGEIYAMPAGGAGSTYRYIGAERRSSAEGWESVGDAGWLDEDGFLYLADRKDDLIISGGVNIWPAEVESALLAHSQIKSCAVFGMPDADLGARVHAVIETDSHFTVQDICEFLGDQLSRPKHPRSIELRSQRVRDDAGKFRKPRLKAET